jgi:hypothetical protein
VLGKIVPLIDTLYRRGIHITLRWIPAYIGVDGNEIVDLLAK